MKTWTEQMILDLIERADNVVLFKMLHSLYERQTTYEQSSEYTRDRNDVGFSAFDAKFLTSVAKNAEQYKRVSNGQAPHIRKAMKKYRKQLVDIANANERKREVVNGLSQKASVAPAQLRDDFAKADDDARDKKPWGGQFEKNPEENPLPGFVARVDREIGHVAAVVDKVMTQDEIDKQEHEMNQMVAKAEKEEHEAVYRSKMLRDEALQGNLYAKSWDEVFKCPPHEWGEYTMQDVPELEKKWNRKYRFTPGLSIRGCHNMVCTKCGEYQFIDSSD